jgi:hypothetical protein
MNLSVVTRPSQVQEHPALAVLGDVLLVHLDDVGGVVGRHLRGELVPVAGPFARFSLDVDVRVGGFELGDHVVGELVARVVTPPGEPDDRLALAVGGASALR